MPDKGGRRSRRRRLALIVSGFVSAVLVIGWLVLPLIVAPVLGAKLRSLVSDRLHAELQFAKLSYRFPYTIHIEDARLIARGGASAPDRGHELLRLARGTLTLDELPLRAGPLRIRTVELDGPELYLMRGAAGEWSGQGLLKRDESPPPSSQPIKLSDLFRLRRLALRGGRVTYTDASRPDAPPMVWSDLTTDLQIAPRQASLYAFRARAGAAPLAELSLDGTIDIDGLLLQLDQLALDARADAQSTALPAAVRELVERYGVAGAVRLDARATIPLREPASRQVRATLELRDLAARVADESLIVSGQVRLNEDQLLLATPLTALYGNDVWTIASARVALSDLPRAIHVSDLAGDVRVARPAARYPRGFGKVIAALDPHGTFAFTGGFTRYARDALGRNDWDMIVTSDDGAFALTPRKIPLETIRGEARMTRDAIDIRRFVANAFDGSVACAGTIDPRRPVSYRGELSVDRVDLDQLARFLHGTNEAKYQVTGRLGGSVAIEAEHPAVEAILARGELHIHQGHLWRLPVFDDVVKHTKVARETLTAGEGAAILSARDGVVHVHHAAVSAPALGLQGWGTVRLRDGAMDLRVVAAPLGDWERHLRETKIPIVSDVVGAVAGTMQKILNTATSTLLYEFRVRGNVSSPQLSAVPTPALTDAAALVFEDMLKREKDLLKPVRQSQQPRDGSN